MTATPQTGTTLEEFLQRDRLIVIGGIVTLAVIAWAYTVNVSREMNGTMAMMQMEMVAPNVGWTPGDFAFTFGMWAVMMAAMMLPSATPMVLTFALLNRKRREQDRPFVPTIVFLVGYLIVWAAFAFAAALAQWGFQSVAFLSPGLATTSSVLGGAILIAAGLYQWSPLKRACLRECQNPISFLSTSWREGRPGAVLMGVRHGINCVGCCWVLMGLLFVGGVMNLVWVAAIALFVLAERVGPRPIHGLISGASGIVLITWGVWTAARALL